MALLKILAYLKVDLFFIPQNKAKVYHLDTLLLRKREMTILDHQMLQNHQSTYRSLCTAL